MGNESPSEPDASKLTPQTGAAQVVEPSASNLGGSGFEEIGDVTDAVGAGELRRTHKEDLASRKLEHLQYKEKTELELKTKAQESEILSRRVAEASQQAEREARERSQQRDYRLRLAKFVVPLVLLVGVYISNISFIYLNDLPPTSLASINEVSHMLMAFLIGLFGGNSLDALNQASKKSSDAKSQPLENSD